MLTGLSPALRTRFARLGVPLASPGVVEQTTEDRALQFAEARVLETADLPRPVLPVSFAALLAATFGQPLAPERIAPFLEKTTVPTGTVLIRQGSGSDLVLLITAGRVEVQLEWADGPVLLATAGSGVVMGELGFCTGVPRTATVLATTETGTETLSRAGLTRMEIEDPELASMFHRLMAHVLAEKLAATTRQHAQSAI
jgi:sulfate permease, SulP family